MTTTEKMIIDMSQANKHELLLLAETLMEISNTLSAHNLKLHIKKIKHSKPISLATIQ